MERLIRSVSIGAFGRALTCSVAAAELPAAQLSGRVSD